MVKYWLILIDKDIFTNISVENHDKEFQMGKTQKNIEFVSF